MKHIIKTSVTICCCVAFYACKPTTTAGLLIGTWRFEKKEGDSTFREQAIFGKDSSITTEDLDKPGSRNRVTYELIDGEKRIVVHENNEMTDTSDIIQINADTLKIRPVPTDTVVLVRVKI